MELDSAEFTFDCSLRNFRGYSATRCVLEMAGFELHARDFVDIAAGCVSFGTGSEGRASGKSHRAKECSDWTEFR